MGDYWEHEIRDEAIYPPPKKSYPVCIGGSYVWPPKDWGGPEVYMECRDEMESYDAYRDMDIVTGFLEDIVAADAPDRLCPNSLSYDVEAAIA